MANRKPQRLPSDDREGGERINNILHLILTILTAGLWAIVWIILAITGGIKRRMVTVDEYGNVVENKL